MRENAAQGGRAPRRRSTGKRGSKGLRAPTHEEWLAVVTALVDSAKTEVDAADRLRAGISLQRQEADARRTRLDERVEHLFHQNAEATRQGREALLQELEKTEAEILTLDPSLVRKEKAQREHQIELTASVLRQRTHRPQSEQVHDDADSHLEEEHRSIEERLKQLQVAAMKHDTTMADLLSKRQNLLFSEGEYRQRTQQISYALRSARSVSSGCSERVDWASLSLGDSLRSVSSQPAYMRPPRPWDGPRRTSH